MNQPRTTSEQWYAFVRVCTRLYAIVRVCTRWYAIVRVCTRLYASGTLGVLFLIGISDLGVRHSGGPFFNNFRFGVSWAGLVVWGQIYASAREYARFNAPVCVSHFGGCCKRRVSLGVKRAGPILQRIYVILGTDYASSHIYIPLTAIFRMDSFDMGLIGLARRISTGLCALGTFFACQPGILID
jgi:hypothetical protein